MKTVVCGIISGSLRLRHACGEDGDPGGRQPDPAAARRGRATDRVTRSQRCERAQVPR